MMQQYSTRTVSVTQKQRIILVKQEQDWQRPLSQQLAGTMSLSQRGIV